MTTTPDQPAFPVLSKDKLVLSSVPWEILNDQWARNNHGQTLQRLADRGGLSFSEMAAIIEKREWCDMTQANALTVINNAIEALNTKTN